MKPEEKIEYVKRFLQARIDQDFPYPFRVIYEEGQFLFRLRNGRKTCCARLKQTDEVVECIAEGSKEQKDKEICRLFEILKAAVQAQESTALSQISNYEKVKNELILRPLNYGLVREQIEDVPHIRIGDVALVLYAVMAHEENDYFTAKMHRSQMVRWNRTEKEVLEEALVNTSFLYPPRLYSVEDLLTWDEKQHEDGLFMTGENDFKMKKGMRGYILTNTLEINGAISVFYPGVAKKIAESFGEDFYIAFTSIHEAQIHPASMISPEVVESSLRDTNRHCNREEEILTNRVYCYRLKEGCFGVIEDGDFLGVKKDA
ncbi:MAG: hypothetical protein IJ390_04240 [Lachnospiraceae bacterium]|nr:hypothetical protein [Lachnospiraceae bacterium]